MTNIANGTKNQPRSISTILKNGTASEVDSGSRVVEVIATAAVKATRTCTSSFMRPDMPPPRLVSFR